MERVYLRQSFERPLLMTNFGLFGMDDITCSGRGTQKTVVALLTNRAARHETPSRDIPISLHAHISRRMAYHSVLETFKINTSKFCAFLIRCEVERAKNMRVVVVELRLQKNLLT